MPRNTKDYHYQPYQRQRPVSCHFCRTRKLRCNRESPCSNCSARGIQCHLYASDTKACTSDTSEGLDASDALGTHNEVTRGVLSRLERLEQALLSKTSNNAPPNSTELRTTSAVANREPVSPATLTTGQAVRGGAVTKPTQLVTDAELLEHECAEFCEVLFVPETMLFKVCPISQITRPQSYIFLPPNDPTCSSWGEPTKCIWLPHYSEAKVLIEKYFNDLSPIHHVIHVPSVRQLVDGLYHQLAPADQTISSTSPEKVALVLAMLTSAIHSQDLPTANSQAIIFTTSTLSVLTYCKSVGPGSLEEIQAMIILAFVVSHLEGLSRRYWSLFAEAVMMSRALGLHLIDDEHRKLLESSPSTHSIRAEMGRRIWWYLVATDWMFARYPGPFEGLYTINPHHMCVRQPLNIDDADLFDGIHFFQADKPISQPTEMSYNIQRIRLSKICLEITDSIPFNSRSFTHEQIMTIDNKIQDFINTLPEFLRLDENISSVVAQTGLSERFSRGIVIQRYIINSLVHAQRCKFHLQYLGQISTAVGKNSPEYKASRDICLNTARSIIRFEQALEHENVAFAKVRLKFSGILYCLFMATMVLGLDLCLNKRPSIRLKPSQGRGRGHSQPNVVDEERKAELVHACRILAQARKESLMAAKLLDSLFNTLKKHQVTVPPLDLLKTGNGDGQQEPIPTDSSTTVLPSIDGELSPSDEDAASNLNAGFKDLLDDIPDLPYFDELWNTFNEGMDFDSLCQGGWFSGREPQF
ncbi:hypothetical protein LTR84_009274 [Exophiala bonariae]|uniref:Zn(2)-C6 fungal-type domain-containing protein n=1 Tax=Exophiala bonariae TaxID=1690606 RepID=A0AAV9MYJ2_9EURO|nr:hypothetical protein LTR84_009274 [Exophiala bonariae]